MDLDQMQFSSSGTQRRVINIGSHGMHSKLLDFDLTNSGGAKRYDQVFDSQISHHSQEHSQEFSSSRAYDSNLTQTNYIKKSETETIKSQTHHFTHQTKSVLGQMKTMGGLERIEEHNSISKNFSKTSINKQTSQSKFSNNMGMGKANTKITNNNNDLSDIVSQSNRLEESVKAPDRLPARIPGLTQFLTDQQYQKTGVFSKSKQALFNFWKDHVSLVYRLRRQQAQKDKFLAHGDTNISQNNPLLQQSIGLGTSFKSQGQKENLGEEANKNQQKSAAVQYQKFEKLYEMDVVYTIQKDLDEEEDEFKRQQLKREIEEKQRLEKQLRQQDQDVMRWMLEEYYQDMKIYKIKQLEEIHLKLTNDNAQNQNKDWHKQLTAGSINPIESLDDDKKEPKKPTMSKEELENEKLEIQRLLDKEFNFMLNLFYAVRDENLTNDPKQLVIFYKQQKEKARLGLTWGKGDEDAERIITKFFKPKRFLKRLKIYYLFRNRLGQFKKFSLFGFYTQIKKRIRQLNFIDRHPIKMPKNVKEQSQKSNAGEYQQQLKFENREYSVEEIIYEYELFERQQNEEILQKQKKEFEDKEKKRSDLLRNKVFGKEKAKIIEEKQNQTIGASRLNELAKPKDKWKRGRILMQLRKKFPHDIVLEKMIREEFKENRIFKYPEEYDQYDDQEEQLRKYWHWDKKGLEVKDDAIGKQLKMDFKQLDDKELYYVKQKINERMQQKRDFEDYVIQKANEYLEMKKRRLNGQSETLRQFVSNVYNQLKTQFAKLVDELFPFFNYGVKKSSQTYKKSYPSSFKKYFFQMVKTFVRNKKGQYKRFKHVPPTFILPGGRKCTIHDFGCPEDCKFITLNKKIVLRSHIIKRKQRDPHTFRSRVWRRRDFKDALKSVYMLSSEIQHCTFEPETGSMSKNLSTTLQVNFNLRNNGYDAEPDPDAYYNKLGKNFEQSHPEVYKAGILKRAKLKYSQGKYEEAMNTLQEGFNIESLRRRYNPHYMKRLAIEGILKAREEKRAKERAEEEKKSVSFLGRQLQKDQPDSQKKRPEEDYENKKLLPVLREAYDLIEIIENRKKDAEKQIKSIRKQQVSIKKQMRSFSSFKRSQTRVDPSKGEKILFKSIMCPLKDNCGKVKKPRWPTSNTRSVTQFGEECPFAHHPMELRFPESIVTKLAASNQTIKNISSRMDSEKSQQIFKPAGRLFDCKGCQKCNLCRYQEMANKENKKFNDPQRKRSLTRSIERRESVEVREDKKEMKQIMDALDLDNNYTKKFGLLKKACVLFFYGRFNDAFDEIAKAVKIIQDQKEIEQNKQRILEKRWRFKLGMDEGFELPIPIEQIDITKVDEKFLKKMELSGTIALSTLKLYIEQIHPMKNEEYSKHAFLNKMVEDYYLNFEEAIEDKQNTIKKMKKQVEKLDEEADLMEAMGTGGLSSPEKSPDKGDDIGGTMKLKPKKTKMCPTLVEKKFCPLAKVPKCPHAHTEFELERMAPGSKMCERVLRMEKCHLAKERKCPFAHNPIELDLISTETKMKNLNSVIQSQTVKLKNMKPIEAWKPAKSGDIEHTHLMDMTSKKRKRHGDDGEDEDDEENEKKKGKVKKSIFERENVFRKPYEMQE